MSENATINNEPIEVTTPAGGHKVVFKPFVTARMQLATRGVYLKHVSIDPRKFTSAKTEGMTEEEAGDLADFDKIPAEALTEIKNIGIQHMVVSVDGSKENILDTVLDMRTEDYDFILAEIEKINKATTIDDTKKK